ncbi:MAG TPA: FtsX-like permease family protein [Bacteroidia bacterium]|nr:FtsX-like permease family protein [Bacteroidia bacterium]
MNTSLFIAKRIIFSGAHKSRISRPIVKIAVWGIALGMAVMITTLAVVNGFQKEIRDKVVGFGSHIQITNYDTNNSLEPTPFEGSENLVKSLAHLPGVGHVQGYALKAGIIHAQDEMLGVVLKGVGTDFNWDFFKRNIQEGTAISISDTGLSNKILISRFMANKLKLNVGDKTRMYFIQDRQQRQRAFRIAGIYETGLEGFDNYMVFADIAHVRKLNNWDSASLAGYEVLLNDFRTMDQVNEQINSLLLSAQNITPEANDSSSTPTLQARTIRELNPQIFNWLDFTDKNASIIISLMLFVAVINMTSALLILILERTHLIGLLKAMGAANKQVRRIFLYHALWLIGQGILIGNIIGIGLSLLQQHWHFLKLDQDSYYVPFVPIHIDPVALLSLNGATMLICLLVLLIPSLIISRITPLKAIRFS